MNAKYIKLQMLWYLLYKNYNLAAVTEYGAVGCDGIADVFNLSWEKMTHEFEVKVSKEDLLGELRSVQLLTDDQTLFSDGKKRYIDEINSFKKLNKHCHYLDLVPPGEGWGRRLFGRDNVRNLTSVPNRFSFAVTPELKDIAVEYLKTSPYGLMVVYGDYNVRNVIKAKWLHKEKPPQELLEKLVRKSSVEMYATRQALSKHEAPKPISK